MLACRLLRLSFFFRQTTESGWTQAFPPSTPERCASNARLCSRSCPKLSTPSARIVLNCTPTRLWCSWYRQLKLYLAHNPKCPVFLNQIPNTFEVLGETSREVIVVGLGGSIDWQVSHRNLCWLGGQVDYCASGVFPFEKGRDQAMCEIGHRIDVDVDLFLDLPCSQLVEAFCLESPVLKWEMPTLFTSRLTSSSFTFSNTPLHN